jgi:hypothetical protein
LEKALIDMNFVSRLAEIVPLAKQLFRMRFVSRKTLFRWANFP